MFNLWTSLVHTSTSTSLSLCFNEQALLSACMRSLHRPCLGTVTVQENGREAPSQAKTVTVMVLLVVGWSGRERYIKGSNVTETLLQTGQTKVDLYCPYEMKNYQKHIQVGELDQEHIKCELISYISNYKWIIKRPKFKLWKEISIIEHFLNWNFCV